MYFVPDNPHMPSAQADRPAIRVDPEVARFIESHMRPKESYNKALRRLLGMDASGAEGASPEAV